MTTQLTLQAANELCDPSTHVMTPHTQSTRSIPDWITSLADTVYGLTVAYLTQDDSVHRLRRRVSKPSNLDIRLRNMLRVSNYYI
jgi:hypothetical protein